MSCPATGFSTFVQILVQIEGIHARPFRRFSKLSSRLPRSITALSACSMIGQRTLIQLGEAYLLYPKPNNVAAVNASYVSASFLNGKEQAHA